MGLREDIQTTLAADATLAALLTGGIYAGTTISRQGTPEAFDANSELLPSALVSVETESPNGPYVTSSRLFLTVRFYQDGGYDVIDDARERVFALLNAQKVGTNVWEILHTDDVLDQADPGLGCSLTVSRYVIHRLR